MSLTKMVKIDAQIDTQFLYTIDSLELITRNPIRKDKNIEARKYYARKLIISVFMIRLQKQVTQEK